MSEPKKRNEGGSAVYGISASQEFWELVEKKMVETGESKSKTIVLACMKAWRAPASMETKKVGRPPRKLRKG